MKPEVLIVVDNDAEMRHLLADALEYTGHPILEAGNAYEVFERLDSHRPLLVITDLEMPGGGLDYLAHLRRAFSWCPIVVVTAAGGSTTQAAVLERGATVYLEKPVRMRELRAVVEQFIAPA